MGKVAKCDLHDHEGEGENSEAGMKRKRGMSVGLWNQGSRVRVGREAH